MAPVCGGGHDATATCCVIRGDKVVTMRQCVMFVNSFVTRPVRAVFACTARFLCGCEEWHDDARTACADVLATIPDENLHIQYRTWRSIP